MKNLKILIVDDEAPQRQILAGWLSSQKIEVVEASNVDEALNILKNQIVDIIISDYKMSDKTGLDLIYESKNINPEVSIIIVTAFGSIEKAVEAMRAGAFDYLTKPIDLDELDLIIKKAKERFFLINENRLLREELSEKYNVEDLVSRSKQMEEVINMIYRVAPSKASILIRGESGTGKEVIAKIIHKMSNRGEKAFVAVNCAALNENLLESELFGHEKGAFTGADKQRRGRFELADGGTLFLDEVGDLPLPTQIKLLRVLQESTFERVGGTQSLEVDVRIIAATNRNIEQLITENKFREDLYYRLNVVTLSIPPLRERKEDILPLVEHFIKKYSSESGKEIPEISKEALDKILKHDFPGNIRELENIIHHSIVLSRGNFISTNDLPAGLDLIKKSASDTDDLNMTLPELVEKLEKNLVSKALEESTGNQSAAARKLGISERNLRYRLEKWGMK